MDAAVEMHDAIWTEVRHTSAFVLATLALGDSESL